MFKNEQDVIVVETGPSIPKHPPELEEAIKLDQVHRVNTNDVADWRRSTRPLKDKSVKEYGRFDIDIDCERKWSNIDLEKRKFAELNELFKNSDVKYVNFEFKKLKLWSLVVSGISKPGWESPGFIWKAERRTKSWTTVKFI